MKSLGPCIVGIDPWRMSRCPTTSGSSSVCARFGGLQISALSYCHNPDSLCTLMILPDVAGEITPAWRWKVIQCSVEGGGRLHLLEDGHRARFSVAGCLNALILWGSLGKLANTGSKHVNAPKKKKKAFLQWAEKLGRPKSDGASSFSTCLLHWNSHIL